ncbi:membrane-associating domain-containing protein [Peziza echinospora]|nr:membrane-associating domain-containing protein [Peziza echinospora]
MGPPLPHLLLRPLQFILTLITLALACSLPVTQRIGGSPERINFAIFTTVFGMLSLLLLAPILLIKYPRFHHPLISLAIDTLNSIFFVAAAIAISAQLGVHSCNNREYLLHNGITNGGGGNSFSTMERRCREGQALAAFLWFGFIAWLAGMLWDIVEFFKTKEGAYGGGGAQAGFQPGTMGTTRGRSPSRSNMAQV